VAPCARCGTFLCGACTELMDDAAFCAECVAWLRRNGAPSRVVQGLIVLGLAGILCFPLCGFLVPLINLVSAVLGLWLPTRELRRIHRGEGPLRGVRQAKVARGLAVVNLLLMLLWSGLLFYGWRQGGAS
jgi:hypothetical protein